MAESDFFVNHKRYPRCKRSHIMYNHTLKGGLRAGNFSMLASVDDIEVCAAFVLRREILRLRYVSILSWE